MDNGVNNHLFKMNIGIESPRVVVQSSCVYLKPLKYPTPVDVGLRIERCFLAALASREALPAVCQGSAAVRLGTA